ncbi:unnamed protein product, partial [Effrenium voratum]
MSVLLAACFNIVSSVSIILVNKQIASVCGFDFILTMLFLNFLTTASLLELLAKLRWFEKKHLPQRDRWLVAGMALSTVLLNNCSNEDHAVAGACAGAVAKSFTAPLERLKLVLQNQHLSVGHAAEMPLRDLFHGISQLLQEPSGLPGLWRGNWSNVLRVLPTYGARFWLFSLCNDALLGLVPQSDTRRFLSGGVAGVGALVLTHPLDTMRTRLAAARVFADEKSYKGLSDCLRRTWRSGGISGLYAGYVASMLEIAPYTAIAFTSYEGVKQRLQGHLPPWAAKICAGVCSGCAATGVCYPLDTVRRQLMLDGALGFDCRYHGSIVRCCRSLCSQGGLVQFYKGWSVTMLKSVPTVTITFFTKANSVGFYQITKLLIIPTVMGLQRWQGQPGVYSQKVILSIVVTGIGVAIATVSDFELNVRGTILALMSILSTAQYQIWQGSKQHEHGVSATQITYSVAWPQSCAGLLSALLADVWVPRLK